MKIKKTTLLAVALLMTAPAWAVNKCTGADGKVAFQDAPCAGKGEKLDVRPASGKAPALAAPAGSAPAAQGAAVRPAATKEGEFGATWQRRTYLENRGVADARSALQWHLNQCDAKQRELASRKGLANNNLAGATWEQSISTEMQATATICDSKTRDLRAQLESLEKELRELQAKQ